VDARTNHPTTLAQAAQCKGNQVANRCKNQGCVQLLGWNGIGRTRPECPHLSGKARAAVIPRADEGIDQFPLGHGNLTQDVCGRSKSVEPNSRGFRRIAQPVCTIANKSCTQQRCGVEIVISIRNAQAISFVRNGILGKSAIAVIARE
jgi:hypothetical protein